MWRPLRFAVRAAVVLASCSSLSLCVRAAEMYSIQLEAGSPIATSLNDEGAMLTHSLHGRYACHSLMGPKCLITNGDSDSIIPAAALTEMLRQVIASTVKARATSPSDAAPAVAAASSHAGSAQQSSASPAELDEAARTRRAAAAARPIASTSGVPYDDDELDDPAGSHGVAVEFEGGEVLYDDELDAREIAELFAGRAQGQGQGQAGAGGQPLSEKGAEVLRKLMERAAAAADKAAAARTGDKDAAAGGGDGGKAGAAASGSNSASGLGGVRNLLSSIFDTSSDYGHDDGYDDGYDDDAYEVEIDGRVHTLSADEFRQFMAEHPWMDMQPDDQQEAEEEHGRGRRGNGRRGQQQQQQQRHPRRP